MTAALIFTGISIVLFVLGYYLGNQLGRTSQIREELQRARDNNIVARIQNQ